MNKVVDKWLLLDRERPSKFPLMYSNMSVCKNNSGINVKVIFNGSFKTYYSNKFFLTNKKKTFLSTRIFF